ncbi:MAG: pyridoxine 5'-phosphate synthase [Pseudomonadota bacterium]
MPLLSVNLNKVALLRNSREGHRPSVVGAARTVVAAGAGGLTVHPRPDQRHIRPDDVHDLARLIREEFPTVEFNIEGNPFAGPGANGYPGFDTLIEATRPTQATLVPDGDNQLTSDHGWDFSSPNSELAEKIAQYQAWGSRVSLFMDPDPEQMQAARTHGADRVELYTGPFAATIWQHGIKHTASQTSFDTYLDAARTATQQGLGVNAGHDLDLENLPIFCRIEEVSEVSIGHALMADALEQGLFATVRAYLEITG